MNLHLARKEKTLLMPLQHQPLGVSHRPAAEPQGCTSAEHSQGMGAKLVDNRALAPPLPIFKEHSREGRRTAGKLEEAIY